MLLCCLLGAVSDEEEEAAAGALLQIGPAAIPALCHVLGEGRTNAEDHAVRVLARIGDGRSAVALVRALADWRSHVRSAAADALLALLERGHVRDVREAMQGFRPQPGGEMAPIRRVQVQLQSLSRGLEGLPLPAAEPAPDLGTLPIASMPQVDERGLPLPAQPPPAEE